MVAEENPRTELIAAISDLYRRAREHSLSANDTLLLEAATIDNTSDFLERIYFNREEFDRHFGKFSATYDIFRGFTADQTVLDVGAHWGYSAVAMRHRGCRSRIVSIEPIATNLPSLTRLRGIDSGMYDFRNVAASDSEGMLRIFIPVINGYANTGLATSGATLCDDFAPVLARHAHQHRSRDGVDDVRLAIVDVPTLPIDQIVSQWHAIVAIKMDVEGHESRALRGARRLILEQKPLLMVEGGNTNGEVVAEMMAHGYFYCERTDGKLAPHLERSVVVDGFWIHPERIDYYRDLGIFG